MEPLRSFLAERAWGTVREDYSADGDAWSYFPHDHARSRAYRWNEDGMGGFSDDKQHICLAVALWNEKDPILKERSGSGQMLTLGEAAQNLAGRLINIFLRDPAHGGRRAVWGDNNYFQTDPNWRDYIPFHEYFNGDTGMGLGASHQTGWTSLVAALLMDAGKSEKERA